MQDLVLSDDLYEWIRNAVGLLVPVKRAADALQGASTPVWEWLPTLHRLRQQLHAIIAGGAMWPTFMVSSVAAFSALKSHEEAMATDVLWIAHALNPGVRIDKSTPEGAEVFGKVRVCVCV